MTKYFLAIKTYERLLATKSHLELLEVLTQNTFSTWKQIRTSNCSRCFACDAIIWSLHREEIVSSEIPMLFLRSIMLVWGTACEVNESGLIYDQIIAWHSRLQLEDERMSLRIFTKQRHSVLINKAYTPTRFSKLVKSQLTVLRALVQKERFCTTCVERLNECV